MCSPHHCFLRTKKYIFMSDYIIYSWMSVFSLTLIHTFLFSLAPPRSKTDFFLCTALFYLIYSWELWFLHPGALIQLTGFYVHIFHCRIMLSDLLHVKSLLKSFFFLLREPENPFHVEIAACLWTHWLIRIFRTHCKLAIISFGISLCLHCLHNSVCDL